MEMTCSFCNEDGDFPIAGPDVVVICKSCITSCVKTALGEAPLTGSLRVQKDETSICNFCNTEINLGTPQFMKNGHKICFNCIALCLSCYLGKSSGEPGKGMGIGVLYAF